MNEKELVMFLDWIRSTDFNVEGYDSGAVVDKYLLDVDYRTTNKSYYSIENGKRDN